MNYQNKYFSILGDSISTLEGYSQPREAAFYSGERKLKSGVFTPSDTWWGQVIERLGGQLLVNDSFSGSMVSRVSACEYPSYACSEERTSALARGGISPDVIMVFMGTNDWGAGVKVFDERCERDENISVFSYAYQVMLQKLQKNYPNAEIWCLTLPISRSTAIENFRFPYAPQGRDISEYCEVIRACAKKYGCRLIDLNQSGQTHDTLEGFHPTADGMQTLAESVLAALVENNIRFKETH